MEIMSYVADLVGSRLDMYLLSSLLWAKERMGKTRRKNGMIYSEESQTL